MRISKRQATDLIMLRIIANDRSRARMKEILLKYCLKSQDPKVRRAASRVLAEIMSCETMMSIGRSIGQSIPQEKK